MEVVPLPLQFDSAPCSSSCHAANLPADASHAESPSLATPRRTTAPVGLQALRGAGSPPRHSAHQH